jgi:large subunit ribosomal protein L4
VYDLAFRTAISLRFAKGELILSHPLFLEKPKTKLLLTLLRELNWTKKAGGGTLFITGKERTNLVKAAGRLGADVTVKRVKDVTVRDLLLMGRIVFERRAFEWLLQRRGVDKPPAVPRDPIAEYERLMKLL